MRFLHISTNNKTLTEETFRCPDDLTNEVSTINYNPGGCIYLSKVNDSQNSEWYDYTVSKNMTEWVDGKKCYFDIDLQKEKILVINNEEDMLAFIKRYGIIHYNTDCVNNLNEEKKEIDNKLIICQSFIDTCNLNKYTNEQINDAIQIATKHKYFPKISDGKIVISNKGKTLGLIGSVLYMENCLKSKLDQLEKSKFSDEYQSYVSGFDYNKMRKDGFNGIYYTSDLRKECSKMKKFDDVDLTEVVGYLEWLRCDTLIIWKWVFTPVN